MKSIFLLAAMSALGTPAHYADIAFEESRINDVDPTLIVALMHTETGGTYRSSAYNENSGACGLMQLMPFWGRHFGVNRRDLFRPRYSIGVAVQVIKYIKFHFKKRCEFHHSRWLCENVITPLHFYRCTRTGANSRRCRNSVGAVRSVQRRLKNQINTIYDHVWQEENGKANSCGPSQEGEEALCSH